MTYLYQELIHRNRLLFWVGLSHLLLLVIVLIFFLIDDRTVAGINTWIKPMKFAVSNTVFVWTVAWFLKYLSDYPRSTRTIAWGVAVAMIVEIFCVTFQAARGVPSHFNFSTTLDSTVFVIMGLGIFVNTLLLFWMTILFLVGSTRLLPAYKLAIRLSLLLFLFASAVGGMMIGQLSHSVGVADGGPGLPFVNWSTQGGDLRIAHFLGIHSLQVIPFFAYRVQKHQHAYSLAWTWCFSLVYFGAVAFIFWEATDGQPLLNSLSQ